MQQFLITLPLITWSYFFYMLYKEKRKQKEDDIYHKRNNCVITFAAKRAVRGWQAIENVKVDPLASNMLPLVEFLKATKKTLDIAIMVFSIKSLVNVLKELKENGVKIRMIIDYIDSGSLLPESVSQIKWNNKVKATDNIFHHKFIIRDYDEETCALLTGSLNFTMRAVYDNYENVVLTTDRKVVDVFQKNFDDIWKYLPLRY